MNETHLLKSSRFLVHPHATTANWTTRHRDWKLAGRHPFSRTQPAVRKFSHHGHIHRNLRQRSPLATTGLSAIIRAQLRLIPNDVVRKTETDVMKFALTADQNKNIQIWHFSQSRLLSRATATPARGFVVVTMLFWCELHKQRPNHYIIIWKPLKLYEQILHSRFALYQTTIMNNKRQFIPLEFTRFINYIMQDLHRSYSLHDLFYFW